MSPTRGAGSGSCGADRIAGQQPFRVCSEGAGFKGEWSWGRGLGITALQLLDSHPWLGFSLPLDPLFLRGSPTHSNFLPRLGETALHLQTKALVGADGTVLGVKLSIC